jgi:hypothetical protein
MVLNQIRAIPAGTDFNVPAAALPVGSVIELDDTYLPRTLYIQRTESGRVHVAAYCENARAFLAGASSDSFHVRSDQLQVGGTSFALHRAELDLLCARLLALKAAA